MHNPNDSELSLTEEPHDLPVGMILNDDQSEVVDVTVISDHFASDQPGTSDTPTSEYSPLTQMGKKITQLIGDKRLTKKLEDCIEIGRY